MSGEPASSRAGSAPAAAVGGGGGSVDWGAVYATDLVYVQDCHRLCGDAHCCSFARHKARFRMLGRKPFQELPLLPGEYEHMAATGALAQFGDCERRRGELALDAARAVPYESIVSHRAGCACEHATRPTICRLYPLFPVHDVAGRLLGVEPHFGVYEELEVLEGLPRACAVGSLPFEQLQLFLSLCSRLAASPLHLFCLHAYRATKRHAVAGLQRRLAAAPQSAFALFEWQMLKGRLVDREALRAELTALADAFAAHYGDRFALPAPTLPAPPAATGGAP